MADQLQDPLPNSSPSPQPPPDIPDGSIHLKVRVPHGNLPASVSATTFSLGIVPITSRIGDVRRMIQQNIPSNPATTRQRLLYGGRSLYDDAESIQDALNTRRSPQQREYVIHLIVRAEAGSDARTESPGRVRTQTPGSAQQIHQNALQQHHQLHQRMHQQNLAQGQQPPFPPFMLPGMPGPQGVPTQGQIGMPPQLQQHVLDPATFQRLQMQQAHLNQGQQEATQTQPNGTNEATTARVTSASVPPPSSDTQPQTNVDQAQQGQAQARPQTQPPDQGSQAQQHQHRHHHHHMNGNFRAEVRGPNGERWEYHQHTFNLPHGDHMGRGSAYIVANNAPPQQGPGMPAHAPPQLARPPHFGPPGWVPGMPAIPGIPQINIPHIQMPQIGMPMQQGQWPPQQAAQPPGLAANVNTANAPAPTGTSALDRARNDLAEIRRMLDELRDHTHPLDPNAQVERHTVDWAGQIEQRLRDVEGYVDPFGLGTVGNTQNASTPDAATTSSRDATPAGTDAQRVIDRTRIPSMRQRLGLRPTFSSLNEPEQPRTSQDVTAYLLSSPDGPQAIVYSPQHGAYTSAPQPTPTRPTQTTQPQQQGEIQRDPAAQAAAHRFIQDVAAQRLAGAQAIAAGRDPAMQDPLGPLQPVLGHFWLLLRILIFAYFLLGSNMGYTKMLMLAGIGLAFWAFRLGVLENREVRDRARIWWQGIVGLPPRPAGQQGQQGQQAQGEQPQAEQNQVQPAQPVPALPADARAAAQQQQQQRPQNRMPTPEQVAQRLLNENADQNRGWVREQIRPVERAVALFVASLWPGIGEAHVRAQRELREQEERRAAEAEVEARRRAEEQEKEKSGEGSAGVAQAGTDGRVEGSTAAATAATE